MSLRAYFAPERLKVGVAPVAKILSHKRSNSDCTYVQENYLNSPSRAYGQMNVTTLESEFNPYGNALMLLKNKT